MGKVPVSRASVAARQSKPAAGRSKPLTAADFVHLHNHSHYSLLDGLSKVPALVARASQLGMQALAITDHGTLSGLVEFYKQAREHNVKPLLGMEAYVAPRLHTDRDPARDKQNYHLTLLAMNQAGYQNLLRLSTIAHLDGFYYKPRLDRQLLERYGQGLIVLSGCIGGEVGDAIRSGQPDQARRAAAWYRQVFGDRYYLEIQDHGHPHHPCHWAEQERVNNVLLDLSRELDIPAVVTADCHYLRAEDQAAHEVLLCVQTNSYLSDERRMSLKEFQLHLTPPDEIIARWGADHRELISNTSRLAARCDVELPIGKILIPQFPVPKGSSESAELKRAVDRGLKARYASDRGLPKPVSQRADYELSVIIQMGLAGYFLIVSDFVNWGKQRGIVFGPGRGSAAGSIVSYALNITDLDPLAYDLLFERFLNPERISMPDIDIDIQDDRRDEVISYCVQKYGRDRVANIVTFGTMAARNAVRDVARVLEVPYKEADRLAKMLPPPIQGRHTPLAVSLQQDADLKKIYKSDQTAKRVFDLAMQLEGTIRSHGVHAAGVVIAPDQLVRYAPLEKAQKGVIATQYAMSPIEELGLLKMDFLGLSNLTIIKNALRIVKKVYGQALDLNQLKLDDGPTLKLFQSGQTVGVFQFESAGMRRYLRQLKPSRFEDLIAMNALYRPGPMQWIEQFVARKNKRQPVTYPHPCMQPALEATYGIIVYQEQVMQIARDMCGFSGGQADTLRKAIGKKKRDVMAKMKQDFIDGARKVSSVPANVVNRLWAELEKFADYAFPKAHAACYATIAYWTAYLKANYADAFMAALMTSDFDNTDRLSVEAAECRRLGITILPPDVNQSFAEFSVVAGKSQIRFGLAAIKNVGRSAVYQLVAERQSGGEFASLVDFLGRAPTGILNKKSLECLIKAGALDQFGDRGGLLHNLDLMVAFAARLRRQNSSAQVNLFGEASPQAASQLSLEAAPALSGRQQVAWERELLGIYLSEHPWREMSELLSGVCLAPSDLSVSSRGQTVTVGGVVSDLRQITTKSGQKMAFVGLADEAADCELVVFPSVLAREPELWQVDNTLVVCGRLEIANDSGGDSKPKIIVDSAWPASPENAAQLRAALPGTVPKSIHHQTPQAAREARLYLRLPSTDDHEALRQLRRELGQNSGGTEVVLVVGEAAGRQAIKLPLLVDPTDQNLSRLRQLMGQDNVRLA